MDPTDSTTRGDEAAGLELLQGFLNTIDVDSGTDDLADVETAHEWFTENGVLASKATVRARDLQSAQELRDGLRALVLHRHDEATDAPIATPPDRLNELLAGLPLHVSFDHSGTASLRGDHDTVAGALATIVAAAPLAVAAGTWERLKICGADDCRWAFYDESRNRSRRWCSMAVCGNRTKTRAFRERQRASPNG